MLDFKELVVPVENDTTKAFCKYCKCDMIAKVHCLKLHNMSAMHKKAIKPVNESENNKFSQSKKRSEYTESRIFTSYVCVRTLFNYGCRSELRKYLFSVSKSVNLRVHHTKCTNIVRNVLAPHFIKEIVADSGHHE